MNKLSDYPEISEGLHHIEEIEGAINYPNNVKLFLISSKNGENKVFKLESDDQSKKMIVKDLIEEIEHRRFKKRDIDTYDITITPKDCHLLVETSSYSHMQPILESIDNDKCVIQTMSKGEVNKINYYMVSINHLNKNYKVIGRFNNITKVQDKLLFGELRGNTLKIRKDSSVMGFNKKPEIIILNNKNIIINSAEAVFDSIFSMKNYITSSAQSLISEDPTIRRVFSSKTIERIKSNISENKRLSATILKILKDSSRLDATIRNIHNIKNIIENESHELYPKVKDIIFDEKTGFIHAPEGEEKQLITVISDAMYTAIISGTDSLDSSRYNV